MDNLDTILAWLSLVAGAFLWYWLIVAILKGLASTRWPRTTGEVISATVEKTPAYRGGLIYTPRIQYRYQVNGARYSSHTITISLKMYFGRSGALKYVERFRTGAPAVVYYNPENPKQSALETGLSIFSLLLLGATALFISGGAMSILLPGWR